MKRKTKRKVIMPFRVKRKILAFLIAMSIILGNLYVPAGVVNAATPVRVGIDNQIPNVYITDENGNPLGASVDAVTGEYLYFYLSPQDETQYEIDNAVQQISVTEIETTNSFIGELIYQTGAKRPYYKYLVTDAVTLRFEEAWSIPLVTPVEQTPVEKEIQINNQIVNTYLKDVNGNDVGSSIKAIPGEIVKFYLEPAAGYTSNGSAAFYIWENSSTNISAPLQRDGQNRYYLSYTVSDTVVALTFVEDGTMFSEPVSAAQYKLTFSIEEGLEAYACAVTNGVVSVYTTKLANQVTVTEGEDYWFAVKEASGYIRDNLTVTGLAGTSVNGVKDGYTLICIPAVNQNATITVSGVREIAPTEHKVTITTIEGLELSPISASDILPGVIVLTGTEDYIYKVKLSEGYRFDSFQVSAAPANGTVEVIGSTATERTIKISGVTSDITVAASGVIPNEPLGTQTFRAYLPGNMTGVSFSGASTIDEGDTYTLTAKVEDGYSIEGVTVKVNGFVINPTPTPALNEYIYIINDVSENLVFTAEGIPSVQNYTVLFGNNIEGAVITDEDGNEITKIVDVPYGTYITFVVKPKEGAILPSYIVTDDGTNTVDPYQYKDGAIYYHYRVEADSLLAIGQAVQEVSYIENDVTIYVPEGLSVTPTLNGIVQAPIEGITGTASGVISVPYGNSLSFTVEIIDTDTYKIAASGLSVTSNVGSIFAVQQNVQYVVNDVKQPIAVAIDGIEKINRTLTFVKGEGISITDGLTLGELMIVDTVREGDFYVFNINALPGYELDPETIKVEGDGALLLSFDKTTGVGAVKIGEKDVVVRVSGTKPTLESQTFNVTIPVSEPWVSFYGLPTVTGGDTYTLKAILKEGYEISGMTVRCNGRILTPVEQTSGEYIYEVSNVTEDLIFSAEGIANLLSYNVLLGNNVEGAIITDLDGNQITKFENITYGEVITFVVKPEKEGTTLPANVDAIDQNNDTVIVYQYKDGAIYYHYYVLEESLITIGEADDKVDTISNEVTIYVPKGLKVTLLGDGILTGQEIDASSANVIETIDVPYGTNVSFAVAVGDTDNYKIAETGLVVTSSAGTIEEKQPNTQYVLNNVKQQISIAIDGVETLKRIITFVKGEGISVTDESGLSELAIVDTVREGDSLKFTIKPMTGYKLDLTTLKVEGEGANLISATEDEATGVIYVGKTDVTVTISGTKPALESLTFKAWIPDDRAGVSFRGNLTVKGDKTYVLTATLEEGYTIDGLTVRCNGQIVTPNEQSSGVYTYEIANVSEDLVFSAEGMPMLKKFSVLFGNNVEGAMITDLDENRITKLENIAYGELITFVVRPEKEGTTLPAVIDTIDQNSNLVTIYQYEDGAIYYHYYVFEESLITVGAPGDAVDTISNEVTIYVPMGLKVTLLGDGSLAGKVIDAASASVIEIIDVPYGTNVSFTAEIGDQTLYKIADTGLVVTSSVGTIEEKQTNTQYVLSNVKQKTSIAIDGVESLARTVTFVKGEGISVTDGSNELTIVDTVKEGDYYEFTIKPTTGFELDPETLTVEGEGAHLTSVSKYLATGVVYVGKTDAVVTIKGTKPALYTLTFKVSIPEDADGVTYTGIGTPGGVLTVQGDGTYELTATLKDGYVIDGLIIKCNGNVVPPVEKSAGVYTYTIEHVAGDLVFTAEGAPKKEYFNVMFENKLAGTTVTNEVGEDISYLKNIAYGSLITFCLKVTEDGTVLPDKSDITMNVINESGILGEIVNYNTVSGVYVISYRVTQDVTIDINSVNPVGIVSNKVRAFVQPGLTAAFSDVFVDGAAAAGKNILNGQIGIQEVGEVNYGKDLNIVVELDTVNYKYDEAGIVVTLTDGSYEVIELDKNTSFTVKNITGPVTLSITGAVKLKDYSINLPTIAAADYQYAQKAGVNVTSVKEGESYQFKVVTNAAYSDSIIETTANLPLNIVANNGNTVTYKIEKVTEDVVVTAAVQDKVVVDDTNGALNDFDLFTFDEDVTPENQQSLSQNRFLYVPTETAVTYAVRVNNPEAFGNDVPNITYTDATHSTPTAVKLYKSEEGVYSFTITTAGNAVIYTGDRLQPNEYTVIADDHNPVISDAAIQVEGVNLNDTNNKVTHGEKFTFSLNVSDPYDPDKFVVKANGVELRKTPAGTYVIANVTENQIISISEPVKKVYKVELRSDSKGIVYTDLTGNEITSGSYKDSNGNKIVSAEVPYGEDFNFKLIKEQNYLSSKVTLTDSLNGILTENSDGTYTVSAVTEARVITMESLDKVVVYLPLNILAGNVTPYYLEAYSDKSSNITVSELSTENNKLTFYVKSGKRFRLDVEMPEGYNKSDVNATFNDTAMERYSVPGIPIIPNEYFLNHDLDTVGNSYHFFSVSVVEGSSVVSVNSVAMNTYNVTLPDETGIEINQMMGYDKDRVEYGSSYKFTITKDFGYTQSELKVTVGQNQIIDSRLNNVVWTTVIVPDANGVYTIPNIRENRYIKIEGIKKNVYTVTYPNVKGIKLKAIYNFDTSKYYNKNYVLHGDDFKFTATLEKAYSKSRFVVKVDKKVLKPDKNGVYTIKNITDFKKIVITGVRLDVKIVADDNTLKPGQSTHVEVINVPKGSSVKLHNDTPNIAVLDSEGNLYALKGGIVKLIAVTREYGEDVYTVKRIRVTKGHYHKDKGTKKVNGLNYKITKKATAKKAGEVEVSLNRYNKDLASDLVIPNHVRISGKKYRVTGIGAGAFYGDSRLRSVSIPESVLRISNSAFVKCRNLTEFRVNSKNHHYAGNGPMLTTGRGTKGTKLIAYPSASGKVKIGAGVANIGAYALSGTTVEELIVERCVVFIDMCAFSHMKKLKKLTFQSKNAKAIECSCILRNVNGCLKVYVPKSAYKAYKAILKEPKGSMTKTVRIYKK